MPYPSQLDRETLLARARDLLEKDGVEALSLRSLAEALGVKAPSLYRYMASKNDLLQMLNIATTQDLIAILLAATAIEAPLEARLLALARAFRAYGHAHPIAYLLAFNMNQPEIQASAAEREALVLPLQALMAELCGEENSLVALRGIYAFLHGWLVLELHQQLQRGGDLGAHFEQAFLVYLAAWRV